MLKSVVEERDEEDAIVQEQDDDSQSIIVPDVKVPSVLYDGSKYDTTEKDDNAIESFAQMGDMASVTADNYYKQYVPYYTQMQGSQEEVHTNKDDLMTKLNYMIHLLEEQQDEKTENVTEELVLYLFLGVFVIFVVDSFARAGKYTR